jgi:hypothetical protein
MRFEYYTETHAIDQMHLATFATEAFLENELESTKKVRRYDDKQYPQRMIRDTLYDHMVRGSAIIRELSNKCIERDDVSTLHHMWFVHDLPEIITKDTPVIASKQTPEAEEIEIVRLLFYDNPRGNELLNLFLRQKDAGDYLKGEDFNHEIDPLGVLMKVIDAIDGNLYFHQKLYKWIENGNAQLPPQKALTWAFDQRERYLSRIYELPDSKYKNLSIDLLNYQIDYIQKLWGTADIKMMPDALYAKLYRSGGY